MLSPTYACIMSHTNTGDITSVRLAKGANKAFTLLNSAIEEEKTLLVIGDDDASYDVAPPKLHDINRAIKRNRRFAIEGKQYTFTLIEAYQL